MRAAPGCFAEFITAFEAEETASKNRGPEPLWLIWQYEGDYTLFDLMQKKDFPYNLEQPLLGRELDMPKGPQRKAVTISLVMQQVGLVLEPVPRWGHSVDMLHPHLCSQLLQLATVTTAVCCLCVRTRPACLPSLPTYRCSTITPHIWLQAHHPSWHKPHVGCLCCNHPEYIFDGCSSHSVHALRHFQQSLHGW